VRDAPPYPVLTQRLSRAAVAAMVVGFFGVVAGARRAATPCTGPWLRRASDAELCGLPVRTEYAAVIKCRASMSVLTCECLGGRAVWAHMQLCALKFPLQAADSLLGSRSEHPHLLSARRGTHAAGYYLNLDYSAKLFVLTFILVVLGSDHASGVARL